MGGASRCIIPSMIVLIGLLGLILGATVNALADSLPLLGKLRLPSCMRCGARRPIRAWVALLAPILRAWRCPYCGAARPIRGVLVELAGLGGAIGLYIADSTPSVFWPDLAVGFVLLLIVIIDIEHRLILHVVVIPAAVLFALLGVLNPERGVVKTVVGGVAGFAIVFCLFLLGDLFGRLISRMRRRPLEQVAFGFGDVTLAGLIGLLVGWPGVLLALFVGVVTAGVFSAGFILYGLLRRKYEPYQAFPYGPFLVLGAFLLQYFPDILRGALGG
jgi:prepilin signal peptidase PulO-like enzyme (type II secretory pathway)